ncbi:MAG: hypothetical protein H6581_13905 [Bacteroidia bacterium]|nr:hypothetical protein [Bacteroidia bacterium]
MRDQQPTPRPDSQEFLQEQEFSQHTPRPWMRRIFMITMLIGTGLVLFLYGMYFNSFSETELVNLSFVWIGCLAFGFSGLEMEKRGKKLVLLKAFGWAFLAIFLLTFFFAAFWSSL